MKFIILIFTTFISLLSNLNAQSEKLIIDVSDATSAPRFPGCEEIIGDDVTKRQCADQKMMQWIYSEIKYPNQARELGIEGTAVISFVVSETGEISEITVRKKVGGGCEEAAALAVLRMSKMSEKWTPCYLNGYPKCCRYNLPVRFSLHKSYAKKLDNPITDFEKEELEKIKLRSETFELTRKKEVEINIENKNVHVKGYYKKDGTYVKPYTRNKPKK